MSHAGDVHFVHLSDPHLTTLPDDWAHVATRLPPGAAARIKRRLGHLSWARKRRFEHRPEVLALLTAHLKRGAPQQIVLSGDLTHIGLEDEFREAAQWLQGLAAPEDLALTPGNHDAAASDCRQFREQHWQAYLRGDDCSAAWPSLRVRSGVAFIGLDSAVVTPPLLATGRVGEAQLEGLGQRLRDCRAAGLFRVVYLHHCPLPGVDKWRKRLVDAGAVQRTLVEAGAELVLHGHGHRYQQHALPTATGVAQIIATPSASARGLHGKDSAAYNAFTLSTAENGERNLHLARWGLAPQESDMVLHEEQRWRYPPAAAFTSP